MPKRPITIAPNLIDARIATLEQEIAVLKQKRDLLLGLKEFEIDGEEKLKPKKSKAGRRPSTEPYDSLKKFIAEQSEPFANTKLRELAKKLSGYKSYNYQAAVRRLVQEGVLRVIEQPMGQKEGKYEKGNI